MPNTFKRRAAVLALAATIGVSMSAGVSASAEAVPGPIAVSNGNIAYIVGRTIYLDHPDVTDPIPIAANAGWGSGPTWSPDGSRFVFARDGKLVSARLYERPDLTLTNGCCADGPAMTRDGALVIYRDGGGLYQVAANGSSAARPLFDLNHPGVDVWPTVAPNGTVVFERRRNGDSNLFRYVPGAAEPTAFITAASLPSFSWDGTKLAYLARDSATDTEHVWVANADGSNPIRLTNEPLDRVTTPAWSPDGSMILYIAETPDAAGTRPIRKIDVATKAVTTVAPHGDGVSWQPVVPRR